MATLENLMQGDGPLLHSPRTRTAAYGSPEWQRDNDAEIAMRPKVLPLNRRKHFTAIELEQIAANKRAGMPSDEAIKAVVDLRK